MRLVEGLESGKNDALLFEGEEDIPIARAIQRAEELEYVRAEKRINDLYKSIGSKASEKTIIPIVPQRQMRLNDPAIRLTKSFIPSSATESLNGLIFELGSPIEEIINYVREEDVDSAELERTHVLDIIEVLKKHAASGNLNLNEEELLNAINDIEQIYEPIGGLDDSPSNPTFKPPHDIGPPPDGAA